MSDLVDPLAHIRQTNADYRAHQHPERGEDLYCLNLTSYMGERMGAVLSHHDAEVAALRRQLDEARAELGHWRLGRRRKGMPVIESIPDGLHYAAELVRSQGTEGGEEHDRLLCDAAMRMKALHDAAAALLVDRDRLLVVYRAAGLIAEHCEPGRPAGPSWEARLEELTHSLILAYRSAAPAEPVVPAPLISADEADNPQADADLYGPVTCPGCGRPKRRTERGDIPLHAHPNGGWCGQQALTVGGVPVDTEETPA